MYNNNFKHLFKNVYTNVILTEQAISASQP